MSVKLLNIITYITCGLIIIACGKSSISVDESTYEPKIVFNGFLYPGNPVTRIQINRNFPLGQTINKEEIALSDAQVKLTDLSTGRIDTLTYNSDSSWYEYKGDDLKIEYGKSYRLDVNARIDGVDLQANSTTTIPQAGFGIVRDSSVSGNLYYRQENVVLQLIPLLFKYTQSLDAAFYMLSISALDASISSFIYENPMGQDINDMIERGRTIEDLQYGSRWKRPDSQSSFLSSFEVNWFRIWFYGQYRFVLYAGDQNYYHYFSTHKNVMGMDGNLHEPIFDIEGDGIGVFGSAIADTIYINVLKP